MWLQLRVTRFSDTINGGKVHITLYSTTTRPLALPAENCQKVLWSLCWSHCCLERLSDQVTKESRTQNQVVLCIPSAQRKDIYEVDVWIFWTKNLIRLSLFCLLTSFERVWYGNSFVRALYWQLHSKEGICCTLLSGWVGHPSAMEPCLVVWLLPDWCGALPISKYRASHLT